MDLEHSVPITKVNITFYFANVLLYFILLLHLLAFIENKHPETAWQKEEKRHREI